MKYLLICAGLLLIVFHSWGQERLADRIAPPSGYVRETCSDNSFTTYLRNLPLLPKGSKVLLYNGKEKANQAAVFAVVDMEIGNRDLQQCADAVIRLRAEYLLQIAVAYLHIYNCKYLHYIPGGVAHRVANTGNSVLSFAACWPSDAGHNYEEIANKGFSARLVEVDGTPKLR